MRRKTNLRRLDARMLIEDVDRIYLAEKMGRSYGYVCTRMQGRYAFNVDDMAVIKEVLHIESAEELLQLVAPGITWEDT